MTPPVLVETDVAATAVLALSGSWVEYWPEVPSLTGRVDIVGRDGVGGLHAVECKTSASLALVAQGAARIQERAFSTVLLVVGRAGNVGWKENDGIGQMVTLGTLLGFGVAWVKGDHFKLELPPRPLLIEPEAVEAVSCALNDIHREVAGAAGGQYSAYWTLWKQGIYELEQAVVVQPGISVRELRYKLNLTGTLYWRNHNAQIRTLAEQSKKVRAEFAGREYKYFPRTDDTPDGRAPGFHNDYTPTGEPSNG